MKITSRKENDTIVISFEKPCYLDNSSEEYFRTTLEWFINSNDQVLIDFDNISYINSSGLGALIRVYASSREKGNVLRIFNLQERINSFFAITKMDTLFKIFPTFEEALKSV